MKISIGWWGSCSIIFLLLTASSYRFLRIQNISCQTTTSETCSAVDQLSQLKNSWVFFTNISEHPVVTTYAQKNNLTLVSYKIYLPHTVLLIFAKNPRAYTLELHAGKIYSISKSGTAELLSEFSESPTIRVTTALSLLSESGSILPQHLHTFLLQYTDNLSVIALLPTSLTLYETFAQLESQDGVQILISYENTERKMRQLEQILQSQAVTALDKPLQEIDLRFDLPVLRTRQ